MLIGQMLNLKLKLSKNINNNILILKNNKFINNIY